MELWDFKPNWTSEITQEYVYSTTIVNSRSGKEQRRALRDRPRMRQTSNHLIYGEEEWRRYSGFLLNHQNEKMWVPDPVRGFNAIGTRQIGTTTVTPPAGFVDNWSRPGHTHVVQNIDGSYMVRTVSTYLPNTNALVYTTPSTVALAEGFTVRPVYSAWGSPEITGALYTPDIEGGQMVFDVDVTEQPNIDVAVPEEIFLNREVLAFKRFNWTTTPQFVRGHPKEVVDYGLGKVSSYSPIELPIWRLVGKFTSMRHSDAEKLLRFFMRRKGRWKGFYMPTYNKDLAPATGLLSGQDYIVCKGADLIRDFKDSKLFKNIYIQLSNGGTLKRRVADMSFFNDGTSDFTTVTVDSPWSRAYSLSEIVSISWMPLVRFSSDIFIQRWLGYDVCETTLDFTILEGE